MHVSWVRRCLLLHRVDLVLVLNSLLHIWLLYLRLLHLRLLHLCLLHLGLHRRHLILTHGRITHLLRVLHLHWLLHLWHLRHLGLLHWHLNLWLLLCLACHHLGPSLADSTSHTLTWISANSASRDFANFLRNSAGSTSTHGSLGKLLSLLGGSFSHLGGCLACSFCS